MNQSRVYDNEHSPTKAERDSYFATLHCLDVPIPTSVTMLGDSQDLPISPLPTKPGGGNRADARVVIPQHFTCPFAMPIRTKFESPPLTTRSDGCERLVGVEIEFGSLDAEHAARIVQSLFGGELVRHNANAFDVENTQLGDFAVKLDTRFAGYEEDASGVLHHVRAELANLFGAASSLVVPLEIAAPPVPMSRLPSIERLLSRLRTLGASGTEASFAFAFGLQLNPEVPGLRAQTITAILKAYALASPWLWHEIDPDPTRRLFRFAEPYPDDYVRLIADEAYWPELPTLIRDYLDWNPTRNRDLDMLPLFAFLDEERVRSRLPDEKIKKRPTFHYRLPDMDLDDPSWGLATEWNRWVAVERLAADEARLVRLCRDFFNHGDDRRSWATRSAELGLS